MGPTCQYAMSSSLFPTFLVSLFHSCSMRRAGEATVVATPAVKGGGRPGARRGKAGEAARGLGAARAQDVVLRTTPHGGGGVGVGGGGVSSGGKGLSSSSRRSSAVEMRRERERRRAREQQPRCGEVAGGTAAECAAVFCCFPFAVVELIETIAPQERPIRAARRLRRPRVPRCRPRVPCRRGELLFLHVGR